MTISKCSSPATINGIAYVGGLPQSCRYYSNADSDIQVGSITLSEFKYLSSTCLVAFVKHWLTAFSRRTASSSLLDEICKDLVSSDDQFIEKE